MSKMPVLATLLVQLRACADAYRTQAIVLNAKLAIIEHERGELRTMREQLAASSARVDHAVDQIARDLTADDNGAR